mmetsp:Transcript_13698/g.27291  ORF Transcript_13698/g.27291 Transcript_13698/m.27291 type:complete len:955 (+) Transcript_13698:71-2935(+)
MVSTAISSKSGVSSTISSMSTTSSSDAKKRFKAREKEWHEEANPVTKEELNSWYLYDWANSVFSSSAVVLWLPVFMYYLAEMKACPYTWDEPVTSNTSHIHYRNQDTQLLSGNPVGDKWEGFFNESTTCYYNWTKAKALNLPLSGSPPVWMERGNPDYGLQYLDDKQRGREPFCAVEDNCNDQPDKDFKVGKNTAQEDKQQLKYDPAYTQVVECNFPTAVKFKPMFNASYYAVAAGSNSKDEFQGDSFFKRNGETATDYDGPINIPLALASDSATGFTVDEITFASSNEFMIDSSKITIVALDAENYQINIEPEAFAVGASTISILITNSGLGFTVPTKVASFTVVQFTMPYCPFPVEFMGMNILPMSFTNVVISMSVIFQAIFFVGFSGWGDFGSLRKQILLQSGIGGALLCMANFTFKDGADYYACGVVFILTNLLFGASVVMYNAYLPFLTKCHPSFQEKMILFKEQKAGGAMKIGKALKDLLLHYADLQDSISATGFLYGYVSGTIVVLITFVVMMMEPSMFGLRLSVFLTGLWWLVFSLPMIPYLEKRPGPPLPNASMTFYASFSFKRLLASMRCLPHIPETMRFTIAYFLYSDAYSTIASVGVLFAVEEMDMTLTEVSMLAIISPLCASIGILIFRWVQVHNDFSNKQMIQILLTILAVMVFYGVLGFFLPFGVKIKAELYGLIIVYGLVLGAIQSYTRTAYCDLVPPGQESEFFGIYEISDKGSSWMGPLICAVLYELTGSMRYAFWYLLFMCLVGLYLVTLTDWQEGSDACRRKEIQVRMEAVRKKLGVSKIAIQMQAKKILGVKSSMASSTASSSVGSMSSTSTMSSVETDPASKREERSVLEKKTNELTDKDIDEAPVDALLQTAGTLNDGETTAQVMPKRKSSMMSIRSRATGASGLSDSAVGSERSTRSRGRKASLLVVAEVNDITGAASIAKPSANQVAPG